MALDMTAAAAVLKERYVFNRVVKLGWRKYPLFALLRKDFGAAGEHTKMPMDIAPVDARSATFATAQTLAANTSTQFGAFEITCVENYSLARVKGKAMAAMRTDEGAFLRAMSTEINRAIDSCKFDTERNLLLDATGILARGDAAWTVSGTDIVLADFEKAHRFRKGMELGFTSASSATPRTGSCTITGMNRAAGTLTTDAAVSGQVTSVANNDYIFAYGDYTAANDRLKISGLEDWCPASAPGATAFFGVDRTQDVELLGGTRYNASGVNLDEAFIYGQGQGTAVGCLPKLGLLSHTNLAKLISILESKKRFGYRGNIKGRAPDGGEIADIGFDTIQIHGPDSVINVLGHPLVDDDTAWLLDDEELVFLAMGEYPSIISDDGNQTLRVYNDNAVEARCGGYPQLATANPGGSIVRIALA